MESEDKRVKIKVALETIPTAMATALEYINSLEAKLDQAQQSLSQFETGGSRRKKVYMIVNEDGNFCVNVFSGEGTVYADKEKAEKALQARNDWSRVKGYGWFELVTLEVKE